MNREANEVDHDRRYGEPAKTTQSPDMGARRLALSNSGLRTVALCAVLLSSVGAALYFARPAHLAGPDSRIRALLSEVEGMALVVPGAEQAGLEPYFLDRFEVTNAQYAEFLAATARDRMGAEYGSVVASAALRAEGPQRKHPVVFVSQPEAVAFAARARKRLPTVAEWRYAAGLRENSSWDAVSRYRMNLLETGLGNSAQVGTFEGGRTRADDRIAPPIYDLIGNVAEWCSVDASQPSLTPIAPVLGGSFNDSILDARARFAQDALTIDDRNWALGFRCARGDAEGWLRQLVAELSLNGSLPREHVERLRSFGEPLRRLIEKYRLREATVAELLPGEDLDVSDRYFPIAAGEFLRIHDSHVERISVDRGRVARTSDLGTIRGFARSVGVATDRLFLQSTEGRQRTNAVGAWFSVAPSGEVELLDARLVKMRFAPSISTESSTSALPTEIPVLTRGYSRCVLTAPLSLPPVALAAVGSDLRIHEIDTRDGQLAVVPIAQFAAAEELILDVDRDLAYVRSRLEFDLPYDTPWAEGFGDGVGVVSAVGISTGVLLASVAVSPDVVGMVSGESSMHRLLIVTERGFDLIDDLALRNPRISTVLLHEDERFRITEVTPFLADQALIQARDERVEKPMLARVASDGALVALRSLDTSDLRATRLAVIDANTIMLIGASDSLICLDGQLRERWRAQGAPYTFEFCPPVEIDLDGDGGLEYAVPFGREGVFGVVGYDARSGRETVRVLTEGHHVLTLLPAQFPDRARGLIAGIRELGLLRLRSPGGPAEDALRRLERQLERKRSTRSP